MHIVLLITRIVLLNVPVGLVTPDIILQEAIVKEIALLMPIKQIVNLVHNLAVMVAVEPELVVNLVLIRICLVTVIPVLVLSGGILSQINAELIAQLALLLLVLTVDIWIPVIHIFQLIALSGNIVRLAVHIKNVFINNMFSPLLQGALFYFLLSFSTSLTKVTSHRVSSEGASTKVV